MIFVLLVAVLTAHGQFVKENPVSLENKTNRLIKNIRRQLTSNNYDYYDEPLDHQTQTTEEHDTTQHQQELSYRKSNRADEVDEPSQKQKVDKIDYDVLEAPTLDTGNKIRNIKVEREILNDVSLESVSTGLGVSNVTPVTANPIANNERDNNEVNEKIEEKVDNDNDGSGDGNHEPNVDNKSGSDPQETTVAAKYKLITMKSASGRRRLPRKFIEEFGDSHMTILTLDRGPVPNFHLPKARRQYRSASDEEDELD